MKLSAKFAPIGKPSQVDGKALTYDWQRVNLSASEVVQHICSGRPIAVAHFKDGHRKANNYQISELIALDYDENYPDNVYEGLIASPFIQQNAFAVIQTSSSHPDQRRARVLFQLDQAITDPDQYKALVRHVLALAPYGADPAATDPARAFYGSKPGTVPDFFNPFNVLPVGDLLQEIERERQAERQRKANQPLPDDLPSDFYQAIESALGAGDYNRDGWSAPFTCPIMFHEHDDINPGASWHKDKHIVKCFKCHAPGQHYLAVEVADALRIERPHKEQSYNVKLSDTILSVDQPTEDHAPALQYAYDALPEAIRAAMVLTKDTAKAQLIDVLLGAGVVPGTPFTMPEVWPILAANYSSYKSAAKSVVNSFPLFVDTKNPTDLLKDYSPQKVENPKNGRPASVYVMPLITDLATTYGVSTTHLPPLQLPPEALESKRAYAAHAMRDIALPSGIAEKKSTRKLAETMNVSPTTVSAYLKILKEQVPGFEVIPTEPHKEPITLDGIGDRLLDALGTIQKHCVTAWLGAYDEDGKPLDYLKKKKFNPDGTLKPMNNRFPLSLGVVTRFSEQVAQWKIEWMQPNTIYNPPRRERAAGILRWNNFINPLSTPSASAAAAD